MIPKARIIECLKMYKISDKVVNFILKAMKNWRVELAIRGPTVAEVIIPGRLTLPHYYLLQQ